jgi:hypothetical protein
MGMRMRWAVPLLIVAILSGWILRDLSVARRGSLRRFDPHAAARIETEMWRSYYEHRQARLFTGLVELLRTQYHLPFWHACAGAYHAAKAAVVFQRGHNRGEYRRALPDIVQFYGLIHGASDTAFDVEKVSRLELEWWIVHRRRDAAALERALAELESAIYRQPASDFVGHAKARAEAMALRDTRAAAGGVTDAGWSRIAALLDRSWSSLARAVNTPSPAPHFP